MLEEEPGIILDAFCQFTVNRLMDDTALVDRSDEELKTHIQPGSCRNSKVENQFHSRLLRSTSG